MKRTHRAALRALAAWLCVFPLSASAHLTSSGMGPIYDGLLHFVLSPEDLVPVLALAMFVGLRGPAYARRALLAVPVSWFAGCVLGTSLNFAPAWPIAPLSFVVFGGLVALDAKVSLRTMTVFACALGLVHGCMNGTGMRWSLSLIGAYAGLIAGIAVVVALVSAGVLRLRQPWMRIAVRVAGSWIVASGLLLFGWSLRHA
ncbi:MAG: HupE/UreJ family protein [Rhodanobacteraceae bacterium]